MEVDPATGQRTAYHFSIPLLRYDLLAVGIINTIYTRPHHHRTAHTRDMAIPFISPTDIGRFAAFAMLNQDRFQHGTQI